MDFPVAALLGFVIIIGYITQQTAGTNQHCGPKEQYVNCVSFCNTCWELNNCRPSFCHPGCDCKPGYYRDYYGQCISENQCYSSLYGLQNSCGANEEYTSCVNPCNDCISRGQCSYNPNYCDPGCDCKVGFLRNEMGVCIPQQNCNSQKCSDNEIYLDCGPSCRSTCENFRELVYNRCRRDCVPGCQCQGNLVLDSEGKCIRPELCPRERSILCPPNERYYVCMPNCRNTCETFNNTDAKCDYNCTRGCFCRDGLVRRQDGVCVRPRDCPVKQNDAYCPPSEVFYQCLPTCRTTCQSLNITEVCSTACQPGCFCQPGFVKSNNGTCVRPEDCSPRPIQTCPVGEIFYNCLPCPNTCEDIKSTIRCTKICRPGCACARGLVKRRDGLCVKQEDCEIVCGENEEFLRCGPTCHPTCDNLNRTAACPDRCVVGCFCINGFVLGPNGECIPRSSCPTTPTPCPTNEGLGVTERRSGSDEQNSASNSTLTPSQTEIPGNVTKKSVTNPIMTTTASDGIITSPKSQPTTPVKLDLQTPTTPEAPTPTRTVSPIPRSDSTTPSSPDSTTSSRPDSTIPTRPDSTTSAGLGATTPTISDSTTPSTPSSTTPSTPSPTTASTPSPTTPSRPDSTTLSRSESTTSTRADSTTPTRPSSTTTVRPGSTTRAKEDTPTPAKPDLTTSENSKTDSSRPLSAETVTPIVSKGNDTTEITTVVTQTTETSQTTSKNEVILSTTFLSRVTGAGNETSTNSTTFET